LTLDPGRICYIAYVPLCDAFHRTGFQQVQDSWDENMDASVSKASSHLLF
jgi:hypothetical protein